MTNVDRISRRTTIGLLGTAGVGVLSGCRIDTGEGTGAGGGGSDPRAISFPDYDTELPTDQVTFRWVDSGGLKSVWERSVLEAFGEKHDNITTEYEGSGWDNVNQVVPLGIRNGSAHDVFALPQEMPAAAAIGEGWVQPIEDLVPDYDGWVSKFPADALVPGVSIFNDQLYTWPASSNRRLEFMQMFDSENMAAAGYDDPGAQITDWDQLTTALHAVVKTGKAGLMLGSDNLYRALTYLAHTAGWTGLTGETIAGGMDLASGEYDHSADEVVAAYELFAELAKDDLLVPGYLSLLAADARGQIPSGGAGMILNGPWDIPAWKESAPDWEYTVAPLPSPTGEIDYLVPFHEGSNATWVYNDTKLPQVVGQVYAYMGSVEGQKMMVILSEGNLQSLIPEANEAAAQAVQLDPKAQRANDLAVELMRLAPRPELRNADVAKVTLELQPVSPTLNDILQGLLTGDLTDARKEFAKHDDALNAALDDAIAAAKKKGSTATREDFAFDNWDPAQDYTIDMYESA